MTTTANPYYLNFIGGTIEINDVISIIETDAVLDDVSGDWIRDIQIYREPDEGASNATLILTVRLKGVSRAAIYFHAPAQTF